MQFRASAYFSWLRKFDLVRFISLKIKLYNDEYACKDTENSETNKEMNKKNTEISARIDETICLLHTNPNKFANALGYGRSQTIYDILNGKSAPSYDFFNRFCNSGYSVFINLHWLLTGEGSPIIEETYYQSDLPIVKGEMTAEEAKKKLEEIRLNKQDSIATKGNSELISIVREQAEEIGRLKARIEELERRRGDDAGHAQTSENVNVG